MPLIVTECVFVQIERMVCHAYSRQVGYNEDLSALRYRLFRKNSANTEKLPPRGDLIQHLYRSHVQARIWSDSLNEVLIPLMHLIMDGG